MPRGILTQTLDFGTFHREFELIKDATEDLGLIWAMFKHDVLLCTNLESSKGITTNPKSAKTWERKPTPSRPQAVSYVFTSLKSAILPPRLPRPTSLRVVVQMTQNLAL